MTRAASLKSTLSLVTGMLRMRTTSSCATLAGEGLLHHHLRHYRGWRKWCSGATLEPHVLRHLAPPCGTLRTRVPQTGAPRGLIESLIPRMRSRRMLLGING